jgi:hypothetical protein
MTLANNYSARKAAMTDSDRDLAHHLKRLWGTFRNADPRNPITQEEAAKALGMSQGSFAQILNGLIRCPDSFILHFAKYIGKQPGELDSRFDFLAIPATVKPLTCTKTWGGERCKQQQLSLLKPGLVAFDLADHPDPALQKYNGVFAAHKNGAFIRNGARYKLIGLFPR